MRYSVFILLLIGGYVGSMSQSFKGTIHSRYTEAGNITQLTWYVDGSRIALDMVNPQSPETTLRFFFKEKAVQIQTLANGSLKNQQLVPAESIQSPKEKSIVGGSVSAQQAKRTFLDQECTQYQMETDAMVAEVWLAPKIAVNFSTIQDLLQADPTLRLLGKEHIKGFPMKTIATQRGGGTLFTHEVIAIENSDSFPSE